MCDVTSLHAVIYHKDGEEPGMMAKSSDDTAIWDHFSIGDQCVTNG